MVQIRDALGATPQTFPKFCLKSLFILMDEFPTLSVPI